MHPRRGRRFVLLLAAGLVLSGCFAAPEPAPSPTPTGFASEAEAYAAAEATYRAFNDASNLIELSDPATFEPALSWTSGEVLASLKETLSEFHADGFEVSGETITLSIVGRAYDSSAPSLVELDVCSDVSGIDVVDQTGISQVAADRADFIALQVRLRSSAHTTTGLTIYESSSTEVDSC